MAIMFLSIFTSAAIYKFVPSFGDDMASIHHQRKSAANAGPAAAVDGPVAHLRRGVAAHGSRSSTSAGTAKTATVGGSAAMAGAGVVGVAAGVAAHTSSAAVRRGVNGMRGPQPSSAGSSAGRHARTSKQAP
jgi:hypothetical protein